MPFQEATPSSCTTEKFVSEVCDDINAMVLYSSASQRNLLAWSHLPLVCHLLSFLQTTQLNSEVCIQITTTTIGCIDYILVLVMNSFTASVLRIFA